MGSSTVDFRGHKFWSRDSALEFWLYMLLQEADKLQSMDSWLRELRNHWHLYTSVDMGIGLVDSGLHTHVKTSEQIAVVLTLNHQAMETLRGFGEFIPLEFLNKSCTPGSYYLSAVPPEKFLQVGHYFEALLEGKSFVDDVLGHCWEYGPDNYDY